MNTDNLKAESNYIEDPLALFYDVTNGEKDNILLESLEIHTKSGNRSILCISSAMRISCKEQQVEIKCLSKNGEAAFEKFKDFLPKEVKASGAYPLYKLDYPRINQNQDEDSRLKALTVLDSLRTMLKISPVQGFKEDNLLAGVFGYDLIASFEDLPEVKDGCNICPDFCFYLIDTCIVIDHKNKNSSIKATVYNEALIPEFEKKVEELKNKLDNYIEPPRPEELTIPGAHIKTNISDEKFCDIVEKLKGNIFRGDIFQVVPSRSFIIPCPSTINAYYRLKKSNPSPYMFYMNDENFIIFGASPESSVKYTSQTRKVQMYPIAGTRGRARREDGSIDLDRDSRIELELRQDKKENAEHLMLVDLARNDIARISVPGTRHVVDLLNVDRYSHVMHLVSRVVGTLKNDLDAIHAYQACMNMGTLTGSPKIMASELIRKTEGERRGSYGGAIGFLNGKGDMDTCIVIRSAFVVNGLAYVQAGCGVVYDSVPMEEANETRKKAAAVLNAIALAHGTTLKEIQ